MAIPQQIDRFISELQKRLNRRLVLALLPGALLLGGAVLWLLVLLVIWRDAMALPWCFVLPPAIGVFFFWFNYRRQRYNRYRAAGYADRCFDLADGLISALDFASQATLTPLQRLTCLRLERQCRRLDVRQIEIDVPWLKLLGLTGWLLPAVILLYLHHAPAASPAPSQAARRMAKLTKRLNRDLLQQFSVLQQELSPAEKQLLKQSGLARQLPEPAGNRDFKAAMLRYAMLERAIDQLAAESRLAANRRLLQAIAHQLLRERRTRSLGKEFQRRNYRQAMRRLEQLKDQAVTDGNTVPLRRALTVMDDAARQQAAGSSRLKNRINRLRQAVENYLRSTQSKQRRQSASRELEQQLDQLGQELQRQQTAESFMEKLAQLRRSLQLAQQKLRNFTGRAGKRSMSGIPKQGKGNRAGTGQMAGNANAAGLHDNSRKVAEMRGEISRLTGKIGAGLSQKELTGADTGTAVSHRIIRNNNRDFHRQLEDLVRRHDIPENMKDGVKNYFNALQESTVADSASPENGR